MLLFVNTSVYNFRDPNSAFAAAIMGFGAVHEHRVKTGLGKAARRRKAEIGLEPTAPPVGLVKTRNGPYAKTDDLHIREVIQLVWDIFFRFRSGRAVVRYLRQNSIKLPRRVFAGITWHDATWSAVHAILTNPAYGGTYIYGKTKIVEAPDSSGRVRKRQVPVPKSEWIIKPDLHPGFVTAAQFAEAQEILRLNRVTVRQPAGRGEALMQGMLRCAAHNRTFHTLYDKRGRLPDGTIQRFARYVCAPRLEAASWRGCYSFSARRLDPLIDAALLARLGPTSLAEIHAGLEDDQREHEAALRVRADELRRAEARAADLEAQYLAASAEHRHVRERLSVLWEEARRRLEELHTKHILEPLPPPERLSDSEVSELSDLLSGLPRIWRHPSVTSQQRKSVVRMLVDRILVETNDREWHITIQWVSGGTTELRGLKRPAAADLAAELHAQGRSRPQIAAALSAAGAASLPTKAGYTTQAARGLVGRIRRQNGFHERAFRLIHEAYLAGTPYADIARQLVTAEIPPQRAACWTPRGVYQAVVRMQQRSRWGLSLLPRNRRLRDEVRRLVKAGTTDPTDIFALLKRGEYLTWHRRQPTEKTVRTILRELGFRARRATSDLASEDREDDGQLCLRHLDGGAVHPKVMSS